MKKIEAIIRLSLIHISTLTKPELKKWVDYALDNDTLILFDAAYEAFIQEDDVPHSIYEIKGAKKCAIEFRSFSKTAGFTGVRCGYTVVPKELTAATLEGERISLNKLWNRRQCTKFNGAGVVHIVVNRFFYLPSAFCGVDGFGGTLGNVACTIKLGALAAVPQFVEGDTFTFQRSGGQFFRYYGVAAAYACKSGCL